MKFKFKMYCGIGTIVGCTALLYLAYDECGLNTFILLALVTANCMMNNIAYDIHAEVHRLEVERNELLKELEDGK